MVIAGMVKRVSKLRWERHLVLAEKHGRVVDVAPPGLAPPGLAPQKGRCWL